jgi:tetratricopeptide (TPR) repeat protein
VEAAHQNYLQMFAELGVVGGSVFLWLMGAALLTGLRARRAAADFDDRAWATAGLCSIIALLVHSFLDYGWYVGAIGVTFWLVAGMLADRARPAALDAPAPAEGEPSARSGRSRGAARPTPTDDSTLRLLPWPGTAPGRTLAIVAVLVTLYVMVSLPVRNARAQHYMERGDAAYFDAQQAFLERDTANAVQNMNAALVFYRKASDLDPGWSRAWEKYGIVQGGQGQVDAGADSIQRAIEHEPTNHMPIKSLGSLYLVSGRYEEAAECYRRALETFPNNTKIWKALAETYQRMGDGASAFHAYQRMVQIEQSPYDRYRALETVDVDDTYAYAHYHLGRAAVLAHDQGTRADGLQAALGEYEAALEIIAAYHATAEETDNMFLLLRRTRPHRGIEIRDLEARVRWRIADVYERLGDADRAAQERGRASALMPDVGKAAAIEDGEEPQ